MAADQAEPLIYMAWLRELMRALFADELGATFHDYFAIRESAILEALKPGSAWCDDTQTAAQEDCAATASTALDHALDFLAARCEQMSVVYCPRTHTFFRHRDYPLDRMLAAGVNVALGTDSRASNPDLELFSELLTVAQLHPQVPPAQILRMGTLNGAQALGCSADFGALASGKRATLTVIRLPDHSAADPHELLLDETSGVVTLSTIAGPATAGN